MKVILTLDYYDGSQSKSTMPMDMEDISMREMVFRMMDKNVCGFTVSKAKDLTKVLDGLNEEKKSW